MILTLTGPAATLSHPMGEGLGVRALFQWKFMAPMRVQITCRWKLSMNPNRKPPPHRRRVGQPKTGTKTVLRRRLKNQQLTARHTPEIPWPSN
jgi:hypothetical protein